MNELLKQKIKSLYQEGHRSVDKILFELNKRGTQEVFQLVPRPLYQLENGFKGMVLTILGPDVQTFLTLNASQREIMVKQKIDAMFAAAETVEGKVAALKTGLELQNFKALLEKSGSTLFSDPDFAKEYRSEVTAVPGQSWLEENGFEQPAEEEIKNAIL